jgi:hypothetical protein
MALDPADAIRARGVEAVSEAKPPVVLEESRKSGEGGIRFGGGGARRSRLRFDTAGRDSSSPESTAERFRGAAIRAQGRSGMNKSG